jgi:hypothetical protein
MAQIDNIDWGEYFESIRKVCPWSLQSFRHGRIDFVPFSWEGIQARDISWKKLTQPNFDAVIYLTVPDTSIDELDHICELMERSKHCIYFWSHPDYTKGDWNQAPAPIVIQQDQAHLFKARGWDKSNK